MVPYVRLQVHALKIYSFSEKRTPLEDSSVQQAVKHMVYTNTAITTPSTMMQIHKLASHFEAFEEEASRQSVFSL